LAVEASDNSLDAWWKGAYTLAQYHQRLAVLPQLEIVRIEDAGHMMHHDQPEILAALIERFMA
jgi:pimeloyl-ACP methyl ester carboxylesterase